MDVENNIWYLSPDLIDTPDSFGRTSLHAAAAGGWVPHLISHYCVIDNCDTFMNHTWKFISLFDWGPWLGYSSSNNPNVEPSSDFQWKNLTGFTVGWIQFNGALDTAHLDCCLSIMKMLSFEILILCHLSFVFAQGMWNVSSCSWTVEQTTKDGTIVAGKERQCSAPSSPSSPLKALSAGPHCV